MLGGRQVLSPYRNKAPSHSIDRPIIVGNISPIKPVPIYDPEREWTNLRYHRYRFYSHILLPLCLAGVVLSVPYDLTVSICFLKPSRFCKPFSTASSSNRVLRSPLSARRTWSSSAMLKLISLCTHLLVN